MFRAAFLPVLASAAVQCSTDDQTAISGLDDNDFGDKSNTCGTHALGLTGINHDKFVSCMEDAVGMSPACAECYYTTAQYGFKNCKAACLLGWCKQGCLDCTGPAQTDLPSCTGIAAGSPTPCLESAVTGACSADEQSSLSDSAVVGKAGSDCGLGAYNVLTGAFNHDKFNTCFTGKVGISSGCSECYATNGEYAAKNCKAACLLGWCKQGCLDCSTADAPKAALDSCTGFTSGSATPCLESAVTGACSADEQSSLSDSAVVGKAGSDCGLGAYNVLTGAFNHDKFNTCFTGKVGISSGCSECYATNGEYAAKNCKAACLLGWCKQGCLDCSTADAPKAALDSCTGFTSGSATPCLESAVTGACSADEQSSLSDSAVVGKAGSDCGLGAYNVLTGAFNHDKFNSCFTGKVGISSGCSECYATNGEYAAKNCKAACLLGWCKQGCLDCSTADAPKAALDSCTGFTSGSATPCLESIAV